MCPDLTGEGASEKGERAGAERRRGEVKGRMHDGRKGRKEDMGIQMGDIALLLLGGIDATANGACFGLLCPSSTSHSKHSVNLATRGVWSVPLVDSGSTANSTVRGPPTVNDSERSLHSNSGSQ